MAETGVIVRLSLRDADTVQRGLEQLGGGGLVLRAQLAPAGRERLTHAAGRNLQQRSIPVSDQNHRWPGVDLDDRSRAWPSASTSSPR